MVLFDSLYNWGLVSTGTLVTDVQSGQTYAVSKDFTDGVAILMSISDRSCVEVLLSERIDHKQWRDGRKQ